MDIGINYVLNGDKTEERVLTTHLNCDPGREFRQMLDTKRAVGKEDGVQYYHIIQSFKPGGGHAGTGAGDRHRICERASARV